MDFLVRIGITKADLLIDGSSAIGFMSRSAKSALGPDTKLVSATTGEVSEARQLRGDGGTQVRATRFSDVSREVFVKAAMGVTRHLLAQPASTPMPPTPTPTAPLPPAAGSAASRPALSRPYTGAVTEPRLMALDRGTTHLRARLPGDNAQVVDDRSAAGSSMAVDNGRFADAVLAVVGDWFGAPVALPVIASGRRDAAAGARSGRGVVRFDLRNPQWTIVGG